MTLENVWPECLEPQRRHTSVTNNAVSPGADGRVRIAISAKDFGLGHWLDTGGHRRGTIFWRFLLPEAQPETPRCTVVPVDSLRA